MGKLTKYYRISITSLFISMIVLFVSACGGDEDNNVNQPAKNVEIKVLYTNDEHGWIDKNWDNAGASGLLDLWKNQEGYTADGNFIVISGGDNFSGQAISTFANGESAIEVMNEIGYDLSTVGNHEFDFGQNIFAERTEQANFPYISCNIIDETSGEIPSYISPYVMKEIGGVKVAIIGLTTVKTLVETRKEYVDNLKFVNYNEALDKWVPKVKRLGAKVILLSCHVPNVELNGVKEKAQELGVSFIGAAHSHSTYSEVTNKVAMVEANCFYNNYAVAKISYDKEKDLVTDVTVEIKPNKTDNSDEKVDAILEKWNQKMESELGTVIGYTDTEIYRYSGAMQNLVCDSWLYYFPNADISVSNIGGVRASIPQGEISNASVMDVLPFDNIIYELELKGSAIEDCLTPVDAIYGGVYEDNGLHFISGREFHPDSTYVVLTSNYMYTSDIYKFNQYDTEPYNTGINWRVPVAKWIEDMNSNPSNSLFQYVDTLSRRQ